jgi:glycosyltransferase involved in cell wall biosynthesis
MILAFITVTPPHPVGGVAMIFEFAGAMARRGHDVHLFHLAGSESPAVCVEDVSWFDFADGIVHHFPPGDEPAYEALRRSEIVFGYRSDESMPEFGGLPVVLIQGYKMMSAEDERVAFHSPCPKVCVARWLVDVALDEGVPPEQLVHIPLGLHHDTFRLLRSIEDRPPRLAFCYNRHPQKGAAIALEVLERVVAEVPDLEVVAFGSRPPAGALPTWVTYRTDPPRDELVEDIYNTSRLFLCSSLVEGFGLPCIEAMACGAALVTTDNGGSRDYAIDGETALVSAPRDVDAMAKNVLELLRDDDRRVALARAGERFVRRFDWDRSAASLEDLLVRYLADPRAYGYRDERPQLGSGSR